MAVPDQSVDGPDEQIVGFLFRKPANGPDREHSGRQPQSPLRFVSFGPAGEPGRVDGVLDKQAGSRTPNLRHACWRSSETQTTRS